MRHIVCFPSADLTRAGHAALAWFAKGYSPLVMLDPGGVPRGPMNTMTAPSPFPGYYRVIGEIARYAFHALGATLVTCAGDDMLPPEQEANWISDVYFSRFPDGFGVMQGTGDMQGMDSSGTQAAARICGSPTFGRGWLERSYGGSGPFCSEYKSYYGDEDLWNVAKLCGVLYLEPRIRIDHEHWSFGRGQRMWWHEKAQRNWEEDQRLFFDRKARGFPRWETKT